MPRKRETHHIPPEIIGRAKARYEAGDRVEDIEKDLGISKNSVVNHAKKNGWSHGSKKSEIIAKVAKEEEGVVIAEQVERSVQETEKFMQDAERLRALTLSLNARIFKSRDPLTNELMLDKDEAELIFQYLKCCKISMEAITMGYYGKRKALRMDERQTEDATILPWQD